MPLTRLALLVATFLGACAPPAGTDLAALPSDAGAGPAEVPSMIIDASGEGPFLSVTGLPAESADGRTVVFHSYGDFGGTLVYVDVASGEILGEESSPEVALEPYAGDTITWEIDHDALERITHTWREGGYRTLRHLPLLDLAETDDGTTYRFENARVRVTARLGGGEDEPVPAPQVEVDDLRSGLMILERDSGAESVTVFVGDDSRYVVIEEHGCGCECGAWSTLVPLPQR